MLISILEQGMVVAIIAAVIFLGILVMLAKWYKKPQQGQVLVRTGGGVRVSKTGMFVIPVLHSLEIMDISVKSIVIARQGKEGLVCKDNLRADIKVTFFLKVNGDEDKVREVAQSIGCKRASHPETLIQLFDAKFSDALKTVGKKFDFVELYDKRDEFRLEIAAAIKQDLNGYTLEDTAIDYLEQTPVTALDEKNILDAEGIKKITDLTAAQKVLANKIMREEQKVIKQQDVEAREAILELERQLTEKEESQRKEVNTIRAREQAEIDKVRSEEHKKSEFARIAAEEEVQVAEENKLRQVIVAAKNKERTEAIENERVEKDRALEANERERIVTLAQIEKEKSVEEERKNIQEVIRDRVAIQKTVVEEEEKIKDTQAHAEADRVKRVAITAAEQAAEENLVQRIKDAEASKQAAEFNAKRVLIEAEAEQQSASQKAEAIKIMADAKASEFASTGLAEAQVMSAKADAREKQGDAEAHVTEVQSLAEAKGIEAKGLATAEADLKVGKARVEVDRERGLTEAQATLEQAAARGKDGEAIAPGERERYAADAEGISKKAEAMKELDAVGKEHEEFKLKLDKEKQVELAQIGVQKDIAEAQATVLSEALKNANIDIVGGDQSFFDKITGAITNGKRVDRLIENSEVLENFKDSFFNDFEGDTIMDKIRNLISSSGLTSEDAKNLTITALLTKMMVETNGDTKKSALRDLLSRVQSLGLGESTLDQLGLDPA